MDLVFKALADPSRRQMLDRLYEDNGLTLNELCEQFDVTRQAVARHLNLLEKTRLVVIVWHGREKRHYLNPMPIQQIHEDWIGKYERHSLQALSQLKKELTEKNK
jgi:DNA-binding transcriptional ArsR family regulator